MQTIAESVRSKLAYLVYATVATIFLIIARLSYLQIHQMEMLFNKSQKNFQRIEPVLPPRGNIIDCHGKLLVTNRPVMNLYWQGSGKKQLSGHEYDLLQKLEEILETKLITDEKFMDELKQSERLHKKILLSSDLSFEKVSQIEEQFLPMSSLQLVTTCERFYPYKTSACHILGYLSCMNMEPCGSMGLEKLFEDSLRGQAGSRVKTINSIGRHLDETEVKHPLAGTTLQTTLDIDIQTIVENIFPPEQPGCLIVMNPQDGAIVGLVSRPNFDPNLFLHPISAKEWHELQDKRPFVNRAFSACYPPGSIFKLVTLSAALEHKMVSPETTVTCHGYTKFCNGIYWCNNKHGHGELSAGQAIAKSCNPFFYEIGKKIDINLIASYAQKYGLGEKTNIIFSEKAGLIPTRQWKMATKKERWWQGETLSAAIGQSFILVTPIQIARMISSIFTGYLATPRILVDQEVVKTPLDIQEPVRAFLQKSMRWAVTQGTGIATSHIKDIKLYVKTSTAQTSRLHKRTLGGNYLEHGLATCYVIYKGRPLTLVILMENIGGSQPAVLMARQFLIEYKKLVDEQEKRG